MSFSDFELPQSLAVNSKQCYDTLNPGFVLMASPKVQMKEYSEEAVYVWQS